MTSESLKFSQVEPANPAEINFNTSLLVLLDNPLKNRLTTVEVLTNLIFASIRDALVDEISAATSNGVDEARLEEVRTSLLGEMDAKIASAIAALPDSVTPSEMFEAIDAAIDASNGTSSRFEQQKWSAFSESIYLTADSPSYQFIEPAVPLSLILPSGGTYFRLRSLDKTHPISVKDDAGIKLFTLGEDVVNGDGETTAQTTLLAECHYVESEWVVDLF